MFLGVNVPGALLSFGDGHYAMGGGEIMGAAIEGAMNVEVYVELLTKTATPVPCIENADEVMFVGSGRPLEDAARVAFKAMVGWVRDQTKMTRWTRISSSRRPRVRRSFSSSIRSTRCS